MFGSRSESHGSLTSLQRDVATLVCNNEAPVLTGVNAGVSGRVVDGEIEWLRTPDEGQYIGEPKLTVWGVAERPAKRGLRAESVHFVIACCGDRNTACHTVPATPEQITALQQQLNDRKEQSPTAFVPGEWSADLSHAPYESGSELSPERAALRLPTIPSMQPRE